jgi:hypothetical protein
VDIPVIASINCVSSHEWMAFADRALTIFAAN